jgi:hypothetical protein
MTRLLPVFALLLLGACNDPGLTVRGSVTAVADDGTTRGYNFPQETRLDAPEGTTGRFTGECQLLRTFGTDLTEQWSITTAINSAGTTDDASPLTNVSIMQTSGLAPEAGQIDITLGGTEYSSGTTGCSVNVEYASADGIAGFTSECDVTSATATGAHVSLQLDLVGCDVVH